MAKKYLSLEEAASALGISTEELNRRRESGEIRGFADRGNWKFKEEDIEKLSRESQADSNPDVPIMGSAEESSAEDSGVLLVGDDSGIFSDLEDDDVGEQPTIIRKSTDSPLSEAASDSDVRLVLDETLIGEDDSGSAEETAAQDVDSDSDVKLVEADSDSDVKLVSDDSASDVQLVETGLLDSDVKLAEEEGTDQDVTLISPSEPSSDSDVQLIGADVGTDEDIPLAPAEDSGETISVLAEDSGIALEPTGDSGIPLLSGDSGIALEGVDDSGIALVEDVDSGISLVEPTDSGIALDVLNEGTPAAATDDLEATQLDVSAVEEGDDTFELSSDTSGSDTGVIVFDDDADFDDHSATVVQKSTGAVADEFDVSEGEEFDFDGGGGFDDELEVTDDVFGEDDELDDMDVFDAGDEDFADSFEGESAAEFISPAGGQVAVAAPAEWGVGTFLGLAFATSLMVFCSIVMFDFVRSMWSWSQPTGFSSTIMEMLGGFFKK
ncbi:MAG: helix-turn-helix domain-containing protein [Planctomycetaceae bacterium]